MLTYHQVNHTQDPPSEETSVFYIKKHEIGDKNI